MRGCAAQQQQTLAFDRRRAHNGFVFGAARCQHAPPKTSSFGGTLSATLRGCAFFCRFPLARCNRFRPSTGTTRHHNAPQHCYWPAAAEQRARVASRQRLQRSRFRWGGVVWAPSDCMRRSGHRLTVRMSRPRVVCYTALFRRHCCALAVRATTETRERWSGRRHAAVQANSADRPDLQILTSVKAGSHRAV